jgi:FKBP-type peptidyl-prolyl cis-trans isomerase
MIYHGGGEVNALMKARLTLIALAALPAAALAQQGHHDKTRADASAKLDRSKASYAVGYQMGTRVVQGKQQLDINTLVQALRDAYAGRHPRVPAAQMHEQLELLGAQLHARAEAGFHRLARTNAIKARQFLSANKQRTGVVTLPSGVQYKVLHKGRGAHPALKSTVVVNYRGSLIDGMEFDSSYAHGRPVTFPVSRMLPGWRDVLPRMRVGGKWKVFIPPAQAYGKQGLLPRIGPNEVLVFEIELIGIK